MLNIMNLVLHQLDKVLPFKEELVDAFVCYIFVAVKGFFHELEVDYVNIDQVVFYILVFLLKIIDIFIM